TRLLTGGSVGTKEDVLGRRHLGDTGCGGGDYYTPDRALRRRNEHQLISAGRHYADDPEPQKISHAIHPGLLHGEAAGSWGQGAARSGGRSAGPARGGRGLRPSTTGAPWARPPLVAFGGPRGLLPPARGDAAAAAGRRADRCHPREHRDRDLARPRRSG